MVKGKDGADYETISAENADYMCYSYRFRIRGLRRLSLIHILQVALPAGRVLRAVQPGVPLPDEGGQEQVRLLREMRQSLQDGRGRDENAQPYRVHPLWDVHPCLSHQCRHIKKGFSRKPLGNVLFQTL